MSNFPLLKLPAVALHEVTKMMMPNEILKLVTCSFQIESFLKYRKYKTRGLHIHLKNGKPQLDVNHSDGIQMVRFDSTTRESLELKRIGDRYRIEEDEFMYLTHVNLDEMFDIHEYLELVCIIPFMEWILYPDELRPGQFYKLFFKILTTNFTKLTILSNTLSSEVLAELMDELPTDKHLEIGAKIPLDFNHPKAFKYNECFYADARWIKLEDLFSIRKVTIVKLESTCFDCSDLNEFLRYWIDCDEFMMRTIEIKLKEGTVYDKEVITDQLTVVTFNKTDHTQYFIKSNKERGQKFSLGCLQLFSELAAFTTLDPREVCKDAHELLTIASKRKELEEELRKIEEQVRGDEVLSVLEMRKKRLLIELEELNIKLRSKLIEFDKPFVV